MKRKIRGLLPVCLLIAIKGIAQHPEIDSMRNALGTAKDDTVKVNSLLALSKAYLSVDPMHAINYADSARGLAESLHYQKGSAYAYKNIGNANAMSGNFLEALDSWEKAMALFTAIDDKTGMANILSNEGAVYYNQSDDARALELYLKALKIAEETADTIRIATVLQNIGAVYSNKPSTLGKALEYYMRAYPLCLAAGNKEAIGNVEVNIGEIYLDRGNDSMALSYFERSLGALRGTGSSYIPYPLNDVGKVYAKRKDYANAIHYHQQAYEMARKFNNTLYMAQSLIGMADTWLKQGSLPNAISYYHQAIVVAEKINSANYELKDASAGLALSYARSGDYANAYRYQSKLTTLKDSLYNIDIDKKLSGLQFNFDIQKKQSQIDLLTKDKALQDLDLKRQKLTRDALIAGLVLVFIIAFIAYRAYRTKIRTNKLLDSQKAQIEALLLNILPVEVAKELQASGKSEPRYYDNVSVLFTDFKSFSMMAERLTPQEVVSELNACFNAFDEIIEKHQLEKIKTIGDSYMCAGGIPTSDDTHPVRMIEASLEIQRFIRERNEIKIARGEHPWDLRVGINVGPVVAGVVGSKKYAYDIWGSTVNIASRMESNGEPGKVNISAAAYERVKDIYNCTYRGKIFAKNIGEVDMYFVESLKASPEAEDVGQLLLQRHE
jgi:class 3 adenylate cyclase/Flp pilus assembly protein TadD